MALFKKKKTEEIKTEEVKPVEEIKPEILQDDKKAGLQLQVKEINEKLDILAGVRKKKEKEAKLKGFNKSKLKKYNKGKKRAVLALGDDGSSDLIQGEYMSGMVKVGEKYIDASAMYTWLHKGKYPLLIWPKHSARPICREELYKKAVEQNTLIDSQNITLRAMKLEQVGDEKGKGLKLGAGAWVMIAIAGIVVIYLFMNGNK